MRRSGSRIAPSCDVEKSGAALLATVNAPVVGVFVVLHGVRSRKPLAGGMASSSGADAAELDCTPCDVVVVVVVAVFTDELWPDALRRRGDTEGSSNF